MSETGRGKDGLGDLETWRRGDWASGYAGE
jgi:hypothetical protein